MSICDIKNLSHGYGDKAIYENAQFSLFKGEHVGVVGKNGAGKSTLISICCGDCIPDSGEISWQKGVRIGHLDQHAALPPDFTIRSYLYSAFAELYRQEAEMEALYQQGAQGDTEALEQACQLQDLLTAQDFYDIPTRLEKTARGLGLLALGMDSPLSQLSGGQRGKVLLAKLILEAPDVLLLDEPTNFLDSNHIDWLATTLTASPKAFLVVSHDSHFLERICTHICDVDGKTLKKYTGSYESYLKQKEFREQDYLRQYHTQQREIEKTEAFIRKNIAGVNTKMAQGRRKQLARIQRLEAPDTAQQHPVFAFSPLALPAQWHLKAEQLSVGYTSPLLSGLSFRVKAGDKLVLTGFNGIGKSTLVKTLMGLLPPKAGSMRFAPGTVIGYYDQDLTFPHKELTPLAAVREAYGQSLERPALTETQARRMLAKCGIARDHFLQPIPTLSGGEQAKVKLCLLLLHPASMLILDEPTNHLDRAAKEALATALEKFPGPVLLVSHEKSFYQPFATKILAMDKLPGNQKTRMPPTQSK